MTQILRALASSTLALGVSLAPTSWAAAQQADHGTEQHTGHDEAQPVDQGADPHGGHTGAQSAEHSATTPEAAFGAMMATMHDMPGMPAASAGDVDVDFLLMMIPHHQGAVDMAAIALEQADDPEVRALAEQIIAAQEEEIAEMRALVERLGVETTAAPVE